ncbi:MAG: hypothetical protein ACI4QD_06820 [Kiritimatiellia bacterium]
MGIQSLKQHLLPTLGLALCVASAHPLLADTLVESFNLTAAVREAVAAGTCQEPVIEEKGSYEGYPASNLFDGYDFSTYTNKECRWLAKFQVPNEGDQCFVTYRVPDDFRPNEAFAIQYYIISRNSNNDTDHARVPTIWSIYGIEDDGSEALITKAYDNNTAWFNGGITNSLLRHGFYIPTPAYRGYRAFKFIPHRTGSSDVVNCGFCELTLSVIPVARNRAPIFDLATDLRNIQSQGLCSAPTIDSLGTHSTYPAERLFDGLAYSVTTNASRRWLAKFTQPNTGDQCFVTYRLPDDYRPGQRFILRQYTLYRNGSNAIDFARVPLEWALYGITEDGTEECITQASRTYEEWGNQNWETSSDPDHNLTPNYRQATFRVVPQSPAATKAYRTFKFVPIQTAAPANESWKCGLVELSLAVEAVSPALPTLILFR